MAVLPSPPPSPSSRALVWFKRDLRLADHAPLVAALAHGDAAGLFILEPEWLHSPECSPSHVAFTLGCLAELRAALARQGLPLLVRMGPATEVLATLHQALRFSHLLSHEETGPGWCAGCASVPAGPSAGRRAWMRPCCA